MPENRRSIAARLHIGWKALRQLGFSQVSQYALYQAGLRSGYFRWRTSTRPAPLPPGSINGQPLFSASGWQPALEQFFRQYPEALRILLAEADEIASGRVRLFGGPAVPLELVTGGPQAHWTEFELGRVHAREEDIKFIWEPARFGWAYTLGRAYAVSRSEGYAQFFWRSFEAFQQGSPPYLGPHWMSGQEVALRLLAFIFAAAAFAASPHTTPERMTCLRSAIADHARRIPPTLVYARAQNNNHLLSEAAGLYSAGLALADLPVAARWKQLGWTWFNRAMQQQIAPDGAYTQHSTNYHRLMLQLALWVEALSRQPGGQRLPGPSRQRLSAAARWLQERVDPFNGLAPNLGANDGAMIMPMASTPFEDFRPVLQAAASAFLGQAALPPGPWDEMTAILFPGEIFPPPAAAWLPSVLKWRLRAVHFAGRPSHADQLHLDVTWRSQPIALDPGTYRYQAPAPWNNALAATAAHNTILLDGQDQMLPAGRFLWLDWAQAEVALQETRKDGSLQKISASHSGYRRLGAFHRRTVIQAQDDRLEVIDEILPVIPGGGSHLHSARLNWLLPDWPWQLNGASLHLASPKGGIRLTITGAGPLTLGRAGERLAGPGDVQPIQGWYSPTYACKIPVLALNAIAEGPLPLIITTRWEFLD